MSAQYYVGVLQMSILDFDIWKIEDVHYTSCGMTCRSARYIFPQSRHELVNTTSAKFLDLTTVCSC